jgi:hypothetical protein
MPFWKLVIVANVTANTALKAENTLSSCLIA